MNDIFTFTLQIIFRDLANHCLYVTKDAGETYNNKSCQLEFSADVIQFSHNEEDYLFAIDNTNSSVSFLTYMSISCCDNFGLLFVLYY